MNATERKIVRRLMDAASMLADGLMEDHGEELATNHFGDGARSCSYCRGARQIEAANAKLEAMMPPARVRKAKVAA